MWNSKGTSKYAYVPKTKQEAPPTQPAPSSSEGPTLYTGGYGGCKAFPEFLVKLQNNNIQLLVDIRIRPQCSFSEDFNGPRLRELLKQNKIYYELFTELGNVFKDVDDSSNLYQELVNTAGELLTRRLRERAHASNVCIMCACGDYRDCHRNKIATFLRDKFGFKIHHI